jgi:hypothetical protein
MKAIARAPRGRQNKVRKQVIAPRRNLNSAAGRTFQDQLEQHVRPEGEEEEDEEGIEDDAEAELEDEIKHDPQGLGHAGDLGADHHQIHQTSHHHVHIDDSQHHNQAELQLIAAANSLVNGAAALTVPVADPSIHPALQALGSHHAFAAMEPPPPPQSHHQGNPMQAHPDHQQHPQHMQQAQGHRTAEQMARDSGYPELTIDSALSKRLAREPGLRHAVQRREEQTLNLKRRSNVEALLAHVSGQITASPCKNCHKGHGPWTSCVVVDGQMCGSCANCWYNASGARCSFHEVRNPQAQHQPAVLATPAPYNLAPMTAAAAALGQGIMHPTGNTPMSFDNQVKYILESAMAGVRAADTRQRLLAKIESNAKALALSIVEYEEYLQSDEAAMAQDAQAAAAAAAGPSGDAPMGEAGEHSQQVHDRMGDDGGSVSGGWMTGS